MGIADRVRASRRSPLIQVAKASVATVGAWLAASALLPPEVPVFAAIAALLVVQPSVNQSLGKAIERCVGVVVGVLIATGIGLLFGQNSLIILLTVVIAIFIAWALKMTSGTANQVAISALLVLALGASSTGYALDRVVETVLGAAIGFVVNVAIVPPLHTTPARRDIELLGRELAASLDRLATALETPRSRGDLAQLMIEARLLRPMLDAAEQSVQTAEEALMLNPRRSGRRQVESLRPKLDQSRRVLTRVVGMTRALHDHYDDTIHAEPAVPAIAEQLRRAAHDLRLLLREGTAEAEETADEPPALTSHLVLPRPASAHWVLIGSLMEDLRRMHDALTAED